MSHGLMEMLVRGGGKLGAWEQRLTPVRRRGGCVAPLERPGGAGVVHL